MTKQIQLLEQINNELRLIDLIIFKFRLFIYSHFLDIFFEKYSEFSEISSPTLKNSGTKSSLFSASLFIRKILISFLPSLLTCSIVQI